MGYNRLKTFHKTLVAIKNIAPNPALFFATVGSIFGLAFILITPPLQGPDEQAHFAQIYRYSEGAISTTGDLPRGVVETYHTVLYHDDIRFNGNEKYELSRTKSALLKTPLEQSMRVDGAPYGGTAYSPFAYLPQIVLVFLGRVFDMPSVALLYLARLGSLVSFIILMYLAIRLSPIAKWPFTVIGLLPMSVFISSMASSDAATIGSVALFVAIIFRLVVSKESVTRMQFAMLAGAVLFMVLTKIINIVLLPSVLLLLFRRGAKTQRVRLSLVVSALIALGVMAGVCWQAAVTGSINDTVANLPQNVVPTDQIKLMIESPQKFLFALWNTYFYAWGDSIYYSLIGTFGWADTPMAVPFVILGYVALALTFLTNRGGDARYVEHLGILPRLGIALVCIGYFLAINAAMYIYYSPVDFNIVVGVQGRYLIPLLLLIALLSVNKDILSQTLKSYRLVTRYTPLILLVVALVYVLMRYYANTRI